jgi:hypothetical protein
VPDTGGFVGIGGKEGLFSCREIKFENEDTEDRGEVLGNRQGMQFLWGVNVSYITDVSKVYGR